MISFTGKIVEIKKKIFQLDENKEYDIEIKEHREKRSLNANSYLWKLCTEIAKVLNSDKDSIYLIMLKRYGVSELIAVSSKVKMKTTINTMKKSQGMKNIFGISFYKGSSKYNVSEMNTLLNGIVSECKDLDIKTKEDLEIERMVQDWKNYI